MIDDFSALSSLIAEIYDTALDKGAWNGVIAKVCSFVGGASVNFFSQQSTSREAVLHFQWGNDPDYERLYIEEYYKLNPLVPATTFVDVGKVFSQSDLITYEEFEETRFYKEWVAPQGIVDVIGANLDKSATAAAMLAVRRSTKEGRVDADCRRKMELVVPHLRRAVLVGNVIDMHKTKATALGDTLMALADGVFLVDPRGRIHFANPAGEGLLRRNEVVRSYQSALSALDAKANRHLLDAIAATENGGVVAKGIAIALSSGAHQWLAHVLPLSATARAHAKIPLAATAAVFIRRASVECPSALETIARLYKLTAMEVRVLKAVVDLGGAPVTADALGISETTVKTHLRNLFQKTASRRQADLVKLVAGAASPFLS